MACVLLAAVFSWVSLSDGVAQERDRIAELLKEEERRYVLDWYPPDTPILGYRQIVESADALLASSDLDPRERQHLLLCRGVAKWCRGDAKNAVSDLRQAVSLAGSKRSREVAEYYYAFAAARVSMDRAAVREIAGRLMKSPRRRERAGGHVILAELAFLDEDAASVLKHTGQALQEDPGFEAALVRRSWALWQIGDVDGAVKMIRRVRGLTVETDQGDVEYWRVLLLFLVAKEIREAAPFVRRAAVRFDYWLLWVWTSEVERALGNVTAARIAALRAFQLRSNYQGPMASMAMCLLDYGRVAEAREILKKIPPPTKDSMVMEIPMLRLKVGLGDKKAISQVMSHPERFAYQTDLWRVVLYLSCYPDRNIRDGEKATKLLEQLTLPPKEHRLYPTCLAIQAVAYAESGDWEPARDAIDRAIKRADQPDERDRLKRVKALFTKRTPYRLDPTKGINQPLFLSFFASLRPIR